MRILDNLAYILIAIISPFVSLLLLHLQPPPPEPEPEPEPEPPAEEPKVIEPEPVYNLDNPPPPTFWKSILPRPKSFTFVEMARREIVKRRHLRAMAREQEEEEERRKQEAEEEEYYSDDYEDDDEYQE